MITITDLTYKHILHNINLTINDKQITCIIGTSGAGKSTLQKILYNNITSYSGELYNNDAEFKSELGVMFEQANFYPNLTVKQNLDYFGKLSGRYFEYLDLLSYFNLQELINTKFSKLSKGMQTRVNYIRAVMTKPKYLFLDEPTSGLDPLNSGLLKKHLASLDATIILTSHNINDVYDLADYLVFLNDGKVTYSSCMSEFTKLDINQLLEIRYLEKDSREKKIIYLTELENYLKYQIISINSLSNNTEDLYEYLSKL